MAVSYSAKSSAMASGTGDISVTVPSGYAAGDVLLMALQGYGATPALPSGWTSIDTQNTTNTYLRVCYKIATASESSVTVTDSGDSTRGIMVLVKGNSASPVHTSSKGISSGASYTAQNGLTTTVDGCLILTFVGFFDGDSNDTSNYSSWTNASLASITEGHDESTNAGSGGGIAFAYGTDTTAGTVNATTATHDNTGGGYSATIMVAIKPPANTAYSLSPTVNATASMTRVTDHVKSLTATVNATATNPTRTYDQKGYHIERKTGSGGTYAEIAVDTASPYQDDGPPFVDGTTYYYKIRYYDGNAGGYGSYSNEASVAYESVSDTPYTLNPTVNVTGSLSRSIEKALTGTVNVTGSKKGDISVTKGGGVNISGSHARITGKILAATVNASSSMARLKQAAKTVSATVNATSNVAKTTGRTLSGSVTASSGDVRDIARSLSSGIVLTASEAYQKSKNVALSTTVNVTGALQRAITKMLSAGSTVTAGKKADISETKAANITVTGSKQAGTSVDLSTTVNLTGSTGKSVGKSLSGSITAGIGTFLHEFSSGATNTPYDLSTTVNISATVPRTINKNLTANINISSTFTEYADGYYYIERKTGSGGTWAEIGDSATSPYQDSSIAFVAGTTYYYRVRLRTLGNWDSYSNEASVTFATNTAVPLSVSVGITGNIGRVISKVLTAAVGISSGIEKSQAKTLTAVVNFIPIDVDGLTWDDIAAFTWDEIATRTWDSLDNVPASSIAKEIGKHQTATTNIACTVYPKMYSMGVTLATSNVTIAASIDRVIDKVATATVNAISNKLVEIDKILDTASTTIMGSLSKSGYEYDKTLTANVTTCSHILKRYRKVKTDMFYDGGTSITRTETTGVRVDGTEEIAGAAIKGANAVGSVTVSGTGETDGVRIKGGDG